MGPARTRLIDSYATLVGEYDVPFSFFCFTNEIPRYDKAEATSSRSEAVGSLEWAYVSSSRKLAGVNWRTMDAASKQVSAQFIGQLHVSLIGGRHLLASKDVACQRS